MWSANRMHVTPYPRIIAPANRSRVITKLDISLPDDVKALADQQVSAGRYPSLSAYLADLIRRDQQGAEDDARRESLLLQRIRSGPSQEMTDDDFARIRDRLEDQISRRRTR